MPISENLKRLRKERRLTQKKLGELCGLAEITIRQYEGGKYQPKIETLEKMARVLGVPIQEIKEDISWDEYQDTEVWKNIDREVNSVQGVIAVVAEIYGKVSYIEKEISGQSVSYWLVGRFPNQFVIHEKDMDALYEMTKNAIQPLVERMKDTRPEAEIVQEILAELNQMKPPEDF